MQPEVDGLIDAVENLFVARKDCYPRQLDGKNEYVVIKQPLTQDIIRNHFNGLATIGCWQTDLATKTVKWVCFDFDGVIEEEYERAKSLFYKLKDMRLNPVMEFSGRRGYHVWLFIEPVSMAMAREFVLAIAKNHEVSDVYPKSGQIGENGYGFQVKLPLGVHRASMKRSFLFDENLKHLSQFDGECFLKKLNKMKRDRINVLNINSFFG